MLAPWKKSYDQLSILKSRGITLLTKVHLVKAMVFPVVMYGCESWTIKKAEYQRTDAFELWCWRRLSGVPWIARRSNQSILKEISPEYSLEGLMLKLKLQYFGHLMQRTDSLEKTLMLGKIEGRRRWGQQRMRWLDGSTDSMDLSLSKLWELVWTRKAGVTGRHGVAKSQAWLSELINNLLFYFSAVLYRYTTVKVCLTNFNKLCFNMFFNFTSGFFDLHYWFHCGWRHIWYFNIISWGCNISPQGRRELDTTEGLNWTDQNNIVNWHGARPHRKSDIFSKQVLMWIHITDPSFSSHCMCVCVCVCACVRACAHMTIKTRAKKLLHTLHTLANLSKILDFNLMFVNFHFLQKTQIFLNDFHALIPHLHGFVVGWSQEVGGSTLIRSTV